MKYLKLYEQFIFESDEIKYDIFPYPSKQELDKKKTLEFTKKLKQNEKELENIKDIIADKKKIKSDIQVELSELEKKLEVERDKQKPSAEPKEEPKVGPKVGPKVRLYTRGTATHGMDITSLLRYINIPSYDEVMNYLKKTK